MIFNSYSLFLILTALAVGGVTVYAWQRRSSGDWVKPFVLMTLGATIWSFGYAFEIAAIAFSIKLVWSKVLYAGIMVVPLSWFVFAFRYTSRGQWITNTRLILLSMVPAIIYLLILTNDLHAIFWKELSPGYLGNIPIVSASHGPGFWIHAAYSYILLLTGTIVLISSLLRNSQTPFLPQYLALIAGTGIPWVANLLYLTDLNPFNPLDLSPFGFSLSSIVLAAALFRFRLFDFVPIARRTVIDNISDGVIVLDDQNRVVDINPVARNLIANDSMLLIGQLANDLLTKVPQLLDLLQERRMVDTEISVESPGQPRFFHVRITPLLHGTDQQYGSVVVLGEITDRKYKEAALQRHKDFLKNIIESIATPFYVIDVDDYGIQMANTAALELGISPVSTCFALTHNREVPCDGLEHPCPLAEVLKTKKPMTVEHIHFDNMGQPRNTEVHAYPVFNDHGEVVQMIEYSIDITERKQAEEQIRKLSRAVEQSANAIVITNLDGIIEFVNPAFSAITGYRFEEAVGQTPRVLKSGKQAEEVYAELWQTLLRGEVWQGELLNRKKNNDLYWQLTTISPVKDAQGNPTHYLALNEDVTEKKQVLEDLAVARDQALEASQAKSEFLAKVSHELRTPLGVILGQTEMLKEGKYGPLEDDAQWSTQQIIGSVMRLTDLVNELLDLASLESGRIRIKNRPFSPEKIVAEVQNNLTIMARSKGLILKSETSPAMPHIVSGDVDRVRQILLNLVGNAIKFTEKGTVTIRLEQPDNKHWGLEVNDTGKGIPQEAQSAIFEPFQQVEGSTPRSQSGAGLGLAIVKQLVELMGGQIVLQSVLGQGSTFTVLLPLFAGTENAVFEGPGPETTRPTAMIIEDDPGLTYIFAQALEEAGCQTEIVTDGAIARTRLMETVPSLVVLDMHLPHVEGDELFRQIKGDDRFQSTRVILATADTEKAKQLSDQADLVLQKPISYSQLRDMTKRLCVKDIAA